MRRARPRERRRARPARWRPRTACAVADHRALRLEQRRVLRHGDDAGPHERAHRRGEPVRKGRGGGGHGPDATLGRARTPSGTRRRSLRGNHRSATALRPCRSAVLRRCGAGATGEAAGMTEASSIVTARAVRKRYRTGEVRRRRPARRSTSTWRAARWSSIMGPSGCGKTTLLNCLSGLDSVDAGEIAIEGVALSAMSRPRAHRLPRPPDGLRLPVLQPDAGPHGGRERRAAAARRPGRGRRGAPPRARGARARRAAAPRAARARGSCPAASASA